MTTPTKVENLTTLMASINDREIRSLLIMLASASNLIQLVSTESHIKSSEINFLNKQVALLYTNSYIILSDERLLRILRSIFYNANLNSTSLEKVKNQYSLFIELITKANIQSYQAAMLNEFKEKIEALEDFQQVESYLSIFAFKIRKVHNEVEAGVKKIIEDINPKNPYFDSFDDK